MRTPRPRGVRFLSLLEALNGPGRARHLRLMTSGHSG